MDKARAQNYNPNRVCLKCGKRVDEATALDDEAVLYAGDVSICIYCGDVAMYDDDLLLRPCLPDELAGIMADPHARRVIEEARRFIEEYHKMDAVTELWRKITCN